MSFKQEIETWVKAVGQYDNHEFEEALQTFEEISDTAKIQFNCGVIFATLGQHQKAVECYQSAIKRDQFLAIAYFQQGVSNFLMGDFEEALANFNDTLLMLRGNRFINYEQLGLTYKLYSCAVLFNRGLCYIYMLQKPMGMQDLKYAAAEKATEEHDVIDEAIAEDAEGYTVFSIGVGTLYRPSSAKVKNLKTKDYLGKARLIASTEQSNTYIASADPKKAALAALERAIDDRPADAISFAASNLVRPGLHSRSRQQSEPPVNRNVFPPTPPPESENLRPGLTTSATSPPTNPPRANSPPQFRPEPLKLQKSSFASLDKPLPPTRPRVGTTRTASEPRGPSNRISHTSRENQQNASGRLYMEAIPSRPHSGGEPDIDQYPDELLEMDPSLRKRPSQSSSSSNNTDSSRWGQQQQQQQQYPRQQYGRHPSIAEEDESGGSSSPSSMDGFEMLNNAGGGLSRPAPQPARASSRIRARSSSRHGGGGGTQTRARSTRRTRVPPAPAPELKQLRVKVHFGDDTRYMMLTPDIPFAAFLDRVKEKFLLKVIFKLKTKDEGDLITMGDADDWEMAVLAARREMVAEARRIEEEDDELGGVGGSGRGGEVGMGKMEVWVMDAA